MEVVMDAFGVGMDDFALATEYKGSEMAKQLCDGNIDAMIYTIGHPAAAIKEATTTCDVTLVDVVGEPIEKLVADNPYYRVATIPAGMYAGNDRDTTTFGVGATFVTSAKVRMTWCMLWPNRSWKTSTISATCTPRSSILTRNRWSTMVSPRRCIRAPRKPIKSLALSKDLLGET